MGCFHFQYMDLELRVSNIFQELMQKRNRKTSWIKGLFSKKGTNPSGIKTTEQLLAVSHLQQE